MASRFDRPPASAKLINATRDRVWAAFTEPDLLAQWWGRGNRLDIERWEFECGGHILIDAVTFIDLGDGRTKVVTDSQFHTPTNATG